MSGRLFGSLLLCLGSIGLGWWLGRAGWLPEARSRAIIRVVVTWMAPAVLLLLFWGIEVPGRSGWLLPLAGLLISCATLPVAWWYARAARLSPPQTGSFLTCAMFSNLGYLGAFVAFAFHGEAGYGLAMLYLLFFTPAFYLIGFTIARRYGEAADAVGSADLDTIRFLPFVGLLIGLGLSMSRLPRPAVCASVTHALIPLETGLYLMAIGSQLHLPRPSRVWVRPVAAMLLMKFGYTPLIGWLVVQLLGWHGVVRFVVLLQAAMPVAISPLMLPVLFGLDRRLSGALWLYTTLAAVPWLLVYLPLIAPP